MAQGFGTPLYVLLLLIFSAFFLPASPPNYSNYLLQL